MTVQLMKDTARLQNATLTTTVSEVNTRFTDLAELIRKLQKQVNQLTPAEIKTRVREIINVDPLVPKADQFEKSLKSMEERLTASEVPMINSLSS